MDNDFEATALEYQDKIAGMSDSEILQAYQATDGGPEDLWAEALARALEERGIDV